MKNLTKRLKLWSNHNNNKKYQFFMQSMQENIGDLIFRHSTQLNYLFFIELLLYLVLKISLSLRSKEFLSCIYNDGQTVKEIYKKSVGVLVFIGWEIYFEILNKSLLRRVWIILFQFSSMDRNHYRYTKERISLEKNATFK